MTQFDLIYKTDPQVAEAMEKELQRQRTNIEQPIPRPRAW